MTDRKKNSNFQVIVINFLKFSEKFINFQKKVQNIVKIFNFNQNFVKISSIAWAASKLASRPTRMRLSTFATVSTSRSNRFFWQGVPFLNKILATPLLRRKINSYQNKHFRLVIQSRYVDYTRPDFSHGA